MQLNSTRVATYFKLKWHNFNWSDYDARFSGWLPNISIGTLVIGYLILFNDLVTEFIRFDNIGAEAPVLFGLSFASRLKFIYFGLVFVGLATTIYRIWRPSILKIGKDEFEYVERALLSYTAHDYTVIVSEFWERPKTPQGNDFVFEINRMFKETDLKGVAPVFTNHKLVNWSSWRGSHQNLLRDVLRENWFRRVTARRVPLVASLILATLGYFLLFVPSLDLFRRVLLAVVKAAVS